MTKTQYTYDSTTNEWVFPDGKRLPVISGGDPTADPNVVVLPPEFVEEANGAGGTTPPAPAPNENQRFTAEDLEKARQQEKDKLYPKIDRMSEQLEVFAQERAEQQRLQAEAQTRADEERKRLEEEELGFKELLTKKEDEWKSTLNTVQSEWEEKLNALKEERDAHAALLDKERRFQELTSYKNRRIQEEADNIMPELYDLVQGETEESIEAAISLVAAKTSAILEQVQQATASRPALRPVPSTGSAPSGPAENLQEQRTLTMDDIKKMDMSTYAANRHLLMGAVSQQRA